MPNNPSITDGPDAQDKQIRGDKAAAVPDFTRHVGGMYFGIPEYHDEQQFQISARAFGPMVYMYASPFLGAFKQLSDIREQGTYGTFAALIEVAAPFGTPLSKEYTDLGLQPGVNCLWLANESEAIGWAAWVTPSDSRTKTCVRPSGGPAPKRLDVTRWSRGVTPSSRSVKALLRGPILTHEDYPAAARFGEAEPVLPATYGQPLLGVKCLDGWCEIGPTGAKPRNPPGPRYGKFGEIKGWHDEQILAAEIGGVLTPTVRAALIPDRNLERYSKASFPVTNPANSKEGWIPVATIVLANDPPQTTKYWGWGLRSGENYVYLRQIGSGNNDWQMSIVRPGSKERYIWNNVTREPHTDVLVPGTARWRFASFDPIGIWVRCGEACCSGDGGFQ